MVTAPVLSEPLRAGQRGPVTSILHAFDSAVADTAVHELTDDRLLPVVLCRACVSVLPVDGASLSLSSGLVRVPLGASDQLAATAEALQFTQGDGPCLEVYRTRQVTRATSADMQQRWPAYFSALDAATPYRTAAAVPFPVAGDLAGAMDLYSRDDLGIDGRALADAAIIAERVLEIMMASLDRSAPGLPAEDTDGGGLSGPGWLQGTAVGQRSLAWVAIGIVRTANALDAVDALDLIRAYAWSHATTFDLVSEQLVSRDLSAEALLHG